MALLVWLPFDNSINNQGLLGNIQNFSLNGLAQNNSGKIGKCYSGYAIYHLSEEFLSNEWSLALWVKATAWGVNNDILLCKNSTASTACQFYFSIINGKTFNLGINGGSSTASYSYTFAINTWYHLVATYDGSNYALYINGNLVKTGTHTSTQLTGHLNLGIGCRSTNDGGTSLTGYSATKYYNDVRIYDHALSIKEVKELAKGLILHYPMNNFWLCENILTNSSGYLGTTNWGGLTSTGEENGYKYLIAKRTDTTSTSRTFCTHSAITSLVSSWQSGDKFTISGWYKVPSSETLQTGGNMFIRWTQSSASNGDTDTGFTTSTTVKDTWIRFENTYTVPPKFASGKAANFYLSAFAALKVATVYWKEIKLEKGDKATPWCPAETDTLYSALGYDSDIELDCAPAGNQNDGTIVGTITAAADSPRYETCTYIQSSNPTTNNNTGLSYIKADIELNQPTAMTVSWWAKPLSGYNGSTSHAAWCTSTGTEPTDYNITAFHHRDSGFDICPNSGSAVRLTFNLYTANLWHHYAVVYDGLKAYAYKDSTLISSVTVGSSITPLKSFNKIFIGFSKAGGAWRKTDGYYSDFRVYCTALSAEDIAELYHTAAQIDKDGNVYAYEFKEA